MHNNTSKRFPIPFLSILCILRHERFTSLPFIPTLCIRLIIVITIPTPRTEHSVLNKCRRGRRVMNYLFWIPITRREIKGIPNSSFFTISTRDSLLSAEDEAHYSVFCVLRTKENTTTRQLREWLTIRKRGITLDITWIRRTFLVGGWQVFSSLLIGCFIKTSKAKFASIFCFSIFSARFHQLQLQFCCIVASILTRRNNWHFNHNHCPHSNHLPNRQISCQLPDQKTFTERYASFVNSLWSNDRSIRFHEIRKTIDKLIKVSLHSENGFGEDEESSA